MELIGDYRIRRLVGQGGMGKVYEAEERLSKRRVALKVLHPELAKSEEGRRLFLNEMEILAGLDDPRLVRSLSSFEADGQLVMVLEFLDGQTLREVLESARVPITEAVRIVLAIASALVAAHGQSPPVIHRDLKPENVMLCHDGKVKVMDFGIAKALTAVQKTHTQTVGTLAYMSPEQIDARPAEPRSDLYALGLVFYELVTGKPPFSSASPRELLNLQCTAAPPPLEPDVRRGVPKTLERLLFQLLEKEPSKRPASAAAVVDMLEPYLPADDERIAPTSIAPSDGAKASAAGQTPSKRTPSSDKAAASEASASSTADKRTPTKAAARTVPDDEDDDDDDEREDEVASERAPKPKKSAPKNRHDTMALLDAPTASREISTRVGVAVIVAASLLSALVGYAVKRSSGGPTPATVASTR